MTTTNTYFLRPGLLVGLKTTVTGGVQYFTNELDPDHRTETGARVAKWETTRQIADAEEHAQAVVARSKARTAIVRHCCLSAFGYLCPEANEAALREGIKEAQAVAAEHNRTAQQTVVDVRVLVGRIASTDSEAVEALAREVRSLLDDMERGVRMVDPDAIREAANKARAMSGMLSQEAQGVVARAINEVRAVARQFVKAGEQAVEQVEQVRLDALTAARFAVLDLLRDGEAQAEPAAPAAPAAPAIDLMPTDAPAAPAVTASAIDFDN